MSMNSNNRKDENNMSQIICENHSVLLWKGMQEGGLLRVTFLYGYRNIEVKSSLPFEFCLDEEFIEFW